MEIESVNSGLRTAYSSIDAIAAIKHADSVFVQVYQHTYRGKDYMYFKVSKREAIDSIKDWFINHDTLTYRTTTGSFWLVMED